MSALHRPGTVRRRPPMPPAWSASCASPDNEGPVARYGVTAVRYRDDEREIDSLMLGLLDPQTASWLIQPAPAALIEVVDRVLDGDEVTPLFADAGGRLVAGPPLLVRMRETGDETLEPVHAPAPGRELANLPRF